MDYDAIHDQFRRKAEAESALYLESGVAPDPFVSDSDYAELDLDISDRTIALEIAVTSKRE